LFPFGPIRTGSTTRSFLIGQRRQFRKKPDSNIVFTVEEGQVRQG